MEQRNIPIRKNRVGAVKQRGETWSHRPMTPLSEARTDRLEAPRAQRQIRLEAELGHYDEGGGVEAVIGGSSLSLP
jgi:hypothetical protein